MNILYLAHRIPYPPNKGDKLRAFRQIEFLSKRHRVWCACFVDDKRDWRHVAALYEFCEDVIAIPLQPRSAKIRGLLGLLRGRTVTESYYQSRKMHDAIKNWCHSVTFDAVVAFSSSMAHYAMQASVPRRILDMCDRDSAKWEDYAKHSRGVIRLLYGLEAERLAKKEQEWVDAFDATVLITKAEAVGLKITAPSHSHERAIHVVGNGVKVNDRVDSPARTNNDRLETGPTDKSRVCGFVGVMDYKPNVDGVCWFARECWPAIRAAHPTARFRIIGRSPTRAVRKLAKIAGIEVVGEVDDVAVELAKIDVSIVPLAIARGLQNKVLEAMAAAKPVVMTRRVATSLTGRDQEHFVIADFAPDFANAVTTLFNEPQLSRRIGQSAQEFVRRHYRWEVELAKLERIIAGVSESSAALWRLPSGETSETRISDVQPNAASRVPW